MNYLNTLLLLLVVSLPLPSAAFVDTTNHAPTVVQEAAPAVLGIDDTISAQNRTEVINRQIEALLVQIKSLQAILHIVSADTNKTYTDRENDLQIKYKSDKKLTFERNEDEALEPIGLLYKFTKPGATDTPGVFLATGKSNALFLAVFDSGLKQGLEAHKVKFQKELPAGVAIKTIEAKKEIRGVTLGNYAHTYQGVSVVGVSSARYTVGDTIYSAAMPYSNLLPVQKETGVMSEEDTLTLLYTMVTNAKEI